MNLVRRLTLTLLCGIGLLFAIDTYLSIRNFARFYDDDVRRDLRMVGRALASEAERLWPRFGVSDARRLVAAADERHPDVSIHWIDYGEGRPSELPEDVA
jgi:putative lipase involved disintegration of autophagic bodies